MTVESNTPQTGRNKVKIFVRAEGIWERVKLGKASLEGACDGKKKKKKEKTT